MGETTQDDLAVGYSAAYPTGVERIVNHKHIHYALLAIESRSGKR